MTTGAKVFTFKLVLLGESSVGKSSLLMRFAKDQFRENQDSTIGAAFVVSSVDVQGDTVKFEIWDTAGQERYHSLAPMYYRGAQAAIVTYDISNPTSFDKAKSWVQELKRQGNQDMVISLVGNKLDLQEESRHVNYIDGQEWAKENGLLFMESSAKTGENVFQVFYKIAEALPKIDAGPTRSTTAAGPRLTRPTSTAKSYGDCC